MTETLLEHPAELAEGISTYGGFAEIARRLNALHPERPKPISRQLVQRWYVCRGTNQFPDRQPVTLESGKIKQLFDLQAVERWHGGRKRTQDAKPPIETIPLFLVDSRGHMIY